MTFSKSSRLALLTLFNTLDIRRCQPAVFVTLTIPDRPTVPTLRDVHRWRQEFIRRIERVYGPKPALWRVEWVTRETGQWAGRAYPHLHLIYFATRYVDKVVVNDVWRAILQTRCYCRTDTQRLINFRQTGYYVSKYLGKADSGSCSLVSASNLNTGRKWGIVRKSLLPLMPLKRWRRVSAGTVAGLRQASAHVWRGVPDNADLGFRTFSSSLGDAEKFLNGQKPLDGIKPF